MLPLLFKKIVTKQDNGSACDILAAISGLSKSSVKRAMISGAVWHRKKGGKERRLRRATFKIPPGDEVVLYYDASILSRQAPQASCMKDYEAYSIWFKPAGLMTQGTRFGDHCALSRQVELYFKPHRKVFILHRIDRETAGLVIIGHNRRAASRFSTMFRERKIRKQYDAWVKGDIRRYANAGEVDMPLDGKRAMTRFQFTEYDAAADQSLVQVELVTGKTHQIRRHFDLIGYPVMGDPRYGNNNKNSTGLQLVAKGLKFTCPFGNGEVEILLSGHSSF